MPGSKANRTSQISPKRRKLIAASAVMPFVATLKSGAALAASSALNCLGTGGEVSNFKLESEGNSISGDYAVRIKVPYYHKVKVNGCKASNTGSLHVFKIDDKYYENSGMEITDQCVIDNLEYQEDAHVLVLYGTTNDKTELYEVGVWPKFQVDSYSDIGNFPINGTCLTSAINSGTIKI